MSVKHVGIFFAVLIIAAAVVTGLCFWINWTQRDYEFRNAVHSHMENAYYSADPDTMRAELIAAKNGMIELGLTNDTYGAWLPWDKTPDKRMDWQYRHIDSILVRIDEFEQWETTQAGKDTSQQMQDVYTQKLDNVRSFITQGGWSDDVAESAYAYNFYFWTTVLSLFNFIGVIIIVVGFMIITLQELR